MYGGRSEAFWRLYCDGGFPGHPGPAAAGIVLYDPQGRIQVTTGATWEKPATMWRNIRPCSWAWKSSRKITVQKLRIFADSELMVKHLPAVTGSKVPPHPLVAGSSQRPENTRAWASTQLPREENHLADAAANRAIDQNAAAR